MINSRNGAIKAGDGFVSGYQQLENNTRVYLYIESDIAPIETGILADGKIDAGTKEAEGRNACAVLHFADGTKTVNLRYGISFISEEQAKENLQRELPDYNLQALACLLYTSKQAVGKQTKVVYEQGCDFTSSNGTDIPKAMKAASQSDVVVLVLGDCSTDVYKRQSVC